MPRRRPGCPTALVTAAALLLVGCGDDRDTPEGAVGEVAGPADAGQDAATSDEPAADDTDADDTDGAIPGRGDDGDDDLGLADPGEDEAEDVVGGGDAGDDAPEGEDDDEPVEGGQAGAGDDGAAEDDGGALPTPGMTEFTAGEFDDIPLPRGADEASEKTERDGVISQSFFAQQTSPEQIMDFFSDSLDADGWTVVEPISSRGTDSLAGAWARDGRRLEISALLAQGVEDERTQFSVVLLPGLEPGEDVVGG